MPFGAGPESENEQDLFSTITSDTEGTDNPFGDLGPSEEGSDMPPFGDLGGEGGSETPFGGFEGAETPEGSFGTAFGDSDPGMGTPLGDTAGTEDPLAPPAGKKGKRPKAAKTPKVKIKKERRIKPDRVPWVAGDYLLIVIAVLMLGLILTVNVFAFLWYAMEAVPYIIAFSALGVLLLLIPFMLWRKRVYGDRINIFDSFLALSLALAILGCMIILSIQSIKYGINIKGTLSYESPAVNLQMESQEGIYI